MLNLLAPILLASSQLATVAGTDSAPAMTMTVVKHLAAAGLHRRVVAGLVSIPGTSLPHLWDGSDAGTVLQQFPWDVVVIQARPDDDTSTINRYVALMSAPVKAHGGRAFVWSQYQGPGGGSSFGAMIDTIASSAAREAQGTKAPVLDAWDAVRRADSTSWLRCRPVDIFIRYVCGCRCT